MYTVSSYSVQTQTLKDGYVKSGKKTRVHEDSGFYVMNYETLSMDSDYLMLVNVWQLIELFYFTN
ncbi:hypothetical protein D929_02214 [Enterococcus faecalis 02-MB-P-10]|nr:hypothetical protein D929_02214 [Enterococcus faecalis 02-MB-P-10]